MRLAFLAPEFLPAWGGVGTYSVELIKNLSRDIDIHVITPKRGDDYRKSRIEEYFNNRITIHNLSTANDNFFYNNKFQFSLLKNFKRLNKRYGFDLIHAANLVNMPDIYLKLQKQNIPSLTTIHTTLRSQSHIDGKKPFRETTRIERLTKIYYPYISFLENIYLRRTSNFIAVSDWITRFVKKEDIRVIHNGIDTERFSPGNQNNKVPKILFSGRLVALKGVHTLIKSMKEVLKKQDAMFLFAGPGDIPRWTKQLKDIPKKNYRFLGYVPYEKINRLYQEVDIFALPSYTESFPLTILEAMASKLPVISTTVGGIPEMIDNNIDGMLITPGSPAQLTSNILRLIEDKNLRKDISRNARKKVEKYFNSKIMAKKTMDFYEDIIEAER